jgi:hypothetical protein
MTILLREIRIHLSDDESSIDRCHCKTHRMFALFALGSPAATVAVVLSVKNLSGGCNSDGI